MLLFLASIFLPAVAKTDELMRTIETRGTIRIGFQEDVTPFSNYDKRTQTYQGFSVDMAEQLVFYLSKRFKKKIRLEPVNLKAGERVSKVLDGTIDIEMGASTKNYKREADVDFSFVYFASETTFLVHKDSGIDNIQDLNAKNIAVGKGTTNKQILEQLSNSRRILPRNILAFDTHNLAFRALIHGKADAYCADRVLLTTKKLQTENPDNWLILEDSIGYEPYAFMMPEHNSDFRDFVNDTIRWTILTGEYFDIYEKWMGPLGVGPFKIPLSFREYLNVISYPIADDWWNQ
jgi:ABC-type amino acid transport substrate-binding protein